MPSMGNYTPAHARDAVKRWEATYKAARTRRFAPGGVVRGSHFASGATIYGKRAVWYGRSAPAPGWKMVASTEVLMAVLGEDPYWAVGLPGNYVLVFSKNGITLEPYADHAVVRLQLREVVRTIVANTRVARGLGKHRNRLKALVCARKGHDFQPDSYGWLCQRCTEPGFWVPDEH